MIVLDAGGLFAALVETEVHHEPARQALEREPPPLILSPFVLAELDYLLVGSVGVDTALRFLREVAAGAYDLADFSPSDVSRASETVEKYHEHAIGLTDASIVILADRYGTNRVLTLDERHFRALRTLDGRSFTLLPADMDPARPR